ncbi:MAG TPA: 16S rRNA (cytosine(967)-C(5))-methyltransferase RsmB [Candidatus Limnocylindrales bacterium]|nr:16S rRNA (cytosine(967)-C(5))-methyltransferase RsmB [Candidatus Limnocylindrales bacterium]
MPASPARVAAFQILLRVERESAYATELLHSEMLEELSPPDRNLVTEIVMGVLRWRSRLDEAIAYFSFSPMRKLDLEVLTALRMGVYQILLLTRVPPHAAVNETVELVKLSKKTSAAGLANAVMRKIQGAQRSGKHPWTKPGLAAEYAHPEWLVERWRKEYDDETAALICKFDQTIPATTLRLANAQQHEQLTQEGIELEPAALLRSAAKVGSGDVTQSELFRSAQIAIQDEGSQLVATLVGSGKRILDCCAAPGGKTGALATRMPEAQIFAAELHPHRARLLRRRAPQDNVQVITADATNLPYGAEFDRVLADVPCSGTGTLARNPEIKWRLRPEDIHDLQARQIAIVRAAMRHVAPGGRLVYSTCSLEAEENRTVVEVALQSSADFSIIPVKEELARLQNSAELVWKDPGSLTSGEFLRTLPGLHPCDGFFAAILERKT